MSAAKLASTTDTAISRKIALQERVVAAVERLHRQRPEAGPAEHDLGRDRPGHDVAEVDRDQRDHREQGVGEGVLVEDAAVREALRPGRRDVVLRPGLDDRGPHQDRVRADQPERDRGQGQHEVMEEVERGLDRRLVAARRRHPRGREPAEARREHDDQRHADDEVRHRVQDQADPVADPVDPAAAFPARSRPDPQPDHDRDRLAQADQQHGRADGVEQDVGDGRSPVLDRVPEVALRRRFDVRDQLVREDGLVEPVAGPQLGDELGGEVGVLDGPLRGARHHPEQHEVQQHDRDDRDEGTQRLACDVAAAHGRSQGSGGGRRAATPTRHSRHRRGYSSSTLALDRRRE